MMSDTEAIAWRFQTLLDCVTMDGPCDESVLDRVHVACGDIKQLVSVWDGVCSSSPPWSVVDSLKDTCVEYCREFLGATTTQGDVRIRIVMAVYQATIFFARRLPVVWQLDAIMECTLVLLKMHALLSSNAAGHHDFKAFLLDELVEILPFMEHISGELMGGLQLPDFWYEAMIRGHLVLAKEADHETVQINSLSNVKRIFQQALSNRGFKHEMGRLAALCTEHHYDAAVTLSMGGNDSSANRKCLHHCNEALEYGEKAVNDLEILEYSVEIGFLINHTRLLKATCLVNGGQLADASKEISLLPDWSGEDDPVYIDLYLDSLLLQMRLRTLLADLEHAGQCLRDLAEFSKSTALCQGTRIAERVGNVLMDTLDTIGDCGAQCDTTKRLQFVDAIVNLMQASAHVGVSAMVHVIKSLPTHLKDKPSFCMPLLFDILTNNIVCALVRAEDPKNQVICWDSFHTMAHYMFMEKDIDTCIKFAHALLHYGPEKRSQWAYVILFALYVYDQNYPMADYSRKRLDHSMKEHPFALGTMLLEELETTKNTSKDVEDRILEDMSAHPEKWSKESVHAIRGIGEMFARQRLQCLGSETKPLKQFQNIVTFCQDESKTVEDIIAVMEGVLEENDSSLRGIPPKDMLNSIHAMLMYIGHPNFHVELSSSLRFFDAAIGIVKASVSIIEQLSNTWALPTMRQYEFAIRILQCNEYLNHIWEIELGILEAALGNCQNVAPANEQSHQAIALVNLRISLLTGAPVIMEDLEKIEQLMGEGCFLEFISSHICHPKAFGSMISKGLLEYLKTNDLGAEQLLLSVSGRVDDDKTFQIYSKVIQDLDNPGNFGHDLFSRASRRLRSKMCFMMPWLFARSENLTLSLTEQTSSMSWDSVSSETVSDSSEVESPPTKKQTLAEADDLVSSLIKDLAEEEQAFGLGETIGSSSGTRPGIWGTWIKKVLG